MLIAVILSATLIAIVLAMAAERHTDGPTVVLHDTGYEPGELIIEAGEEVTFRTERDKPFWPASNVHPTHDVYSAFDPKKPIAANETWTFRFDDPGRYRYHDHIAPYFSGTIVVTGDEAELPPDQCDHGEASAECWQIDLTAALERGGMAEMLARSEELHAQQPGFAESCHGIMHNVGIVAYGDYLEDPHSVLHKDASVCASGFYHGFMEAYIGDTHDMAGADSVCDFFSQELDAKAPDTGMQCYHGIGHGILDLMLLDPEARTSEEALLEPALRACEQVSEESAKVYRCVSGIFNGIANMYIEGQYAIRPEDPLWVCHGQPGGEFESYRHSCYGNMNSLMYWLSENTLAGALTYVGLIPEQRDAAVAVKYLSGLATIYEASAGMDALIASCRKGAPPELVSDCIAGLAVGFLEHGSAGSRLANAIALCGSATLTDPEADYCFTYLVEILPTWYGQDEATRVCAQLDNTYQEACYTSFR